MANKNATIKNIMLVDDDPEALRLYKHLLGEKSGIQVEAIRHPSVALKLASQRLFECVLIDVTMNYKGTSFGGIELYRELLGRYGRDSITVYSQYITDNLLKRYDYEFNFLERGEDVLLFVDAVYRHMVQLRKRQTCFVAMPFGSSYDSIYLEIKKAIVDAGYIPVRVDEQTFTRSIVEQVFDEIARSKLIVFVATDRNPNAFYEAGFAVALKKEVVTVTDDLRNLPFDIRDRSAIAYGRRLGQLRRELSVRLGL